MAMRLMNEQMGLKLGDMPCKSTLANWLHKSGYRTYIQEKESGFDKDYAIIIDECLVVGKQSLLLILGIPAKKEEPGALVFSQVKVLRMSVRGSWTKEMIKEEVEKVMEEMGKKPCYIISDGCSNLIGAINLLGITRIFDIGHEIARLISRTYEKEEDLDRFSKACSLSKSQIVMKPASYLSPPKQRTIARFMNISHIMHWAEKLYKVKKKLNKQERETYKWITGHKLIIKEFSMIIRYIQPILKEFKEEGMSYSTINKQVEVCQTAAREAKAKKYQRAVNLFENIEAYLKTEETKLPDALTTYYMSSDIIESMFGKYKNGKPDNRMYGVTIHILTLPLMTKMNLEKSSIDIDIKEALESVLMSDLATWKAESLFENQVIKRRKVLNN